MLDARCRLQDTGCRVLGGSEPTRQLGKPVSGSPQLHILPKPIAAGKPLPQEQRCASLEEKEPAVPRNRRLLLFAAMPSTDGRKAESIDSGIKP
jgi:hypothetical protein